MLTSPTKQNVRAVFSRQQSMRYKFLLRLQSTKATSGVRNIQPPKRKYKTEFNHQMAVYNAIDTSVEPLDIILGVRTMYF
jgi:hypothetical protein